MDRNPGSDDDRGRTAGPPAGAKAAASAGPARTGDYGGQLRFYKLLSLCLIVVGAVAVCTYLYRQSRSQPVSILVDGATVATVSDAREADALVSGLSAEELSPAYAGSTRPQMKESVTLKRMPMDTPIDLRQTALRRLIAATHLTVLADVIKVNGKPVVALPDARSAQEALDQVREHYATLPTNQPPVDKPEFREAVVIERDRVPVKLCADSAAQVFRILTTAPAPKLYTVKMGQTGWTIAHKVHMLFSDFIHANNGADINHLKPGDTVNISATYPPLTVIVHKQIVNDEPIEPGAPAESAGERQVTSIVTYVNGVRTDDSTPVSIYTIQRAKPRRFLN